VCGWIATLNGSYDAVSAFGVLKQKIMFWGKIPKNVNFGGENWHFKPDVQNVQMAISLKVIKRLK